MTVTYTSKVATSSFSGFLKLLVRWKGSIYKLVWKDFAAFTIIYYILGFIYRFGLPHDGKRIFESIANYCEQFNQLIPVAFILGFYVSMVVGRFWDQLNSLPWPNRLSVFVSALVQGRDTRGRLLRRTIVRYLSQTYILTMRSFCPAVMKRFPTYDHICEAGIMLQSEKEVLEEMVTKSNLYFVPLVWAASLVTRARKEGRVKDDFAVKTLIDEINDYRGKCGSLFCYDWITVPLVYTQVVTIAVYTFFLSCLMGRQYLERTDKTQANEMLFPVFTFLQFFFYMGWLKLKLASTQTLPWTQLLATMYFRLLLRDIEAVVCVPPAITASSVMAVVIVAESMLNPFGEDDDDFDINSLVDSNLECSYLIVDNMYDKIPEMLEDKYWDTLDIALPYTVESEQFRTPAFHGSAMDIRVPPSKAEFIAGSMSPIHEDDEQSSHSNTSMPIHRKFTRQLTNNSTIGSLRHMMARSLSRRNERSNTVDSESVPSTPVALQDRGLSGTNRLSTVTAEDETQFQMSDIEEQTSLLGEKEPHYGVVEFVDSSPISVDNNTNDIVQGVSTIEPTEQQSFVNVITSVREQLRLMREDSTVQSQTSTQ